MPTRSVETRSPGLAYRIILALALVAASVGLSLGAAPQPAQAATTTMCSNAAVPSGYVVTHAYRDSTCGSYFRYYITNNLTNGMGICSVKVPAGWVVTHAYSGDSSCSSFLRYYITSNLTNGMGICSVTVPAGWIVTHAYSGDSSCSSFLRYYITRVS